MQPGEGQDSEDGQYSQGKLGLSQVSRLTLKAGIKIFGPQTNFQVYIYDPSEPFFYELFFVSIKKMEHWETQVKLGQPS